MFNVKQNLNDIKFILRDSAVLLHQLNHSNKEYINNKYGVIDTIQYQNNPSVQEQNMLVSRYIDINKCLKNVKHKYKFYDTTTITTNNKSPCIINDSIYHELMYIIQCIMIYMTIYGLSYSIFKKITDFKKYQADIKNLNYDDELDKKIIKYNYESSSKQEYLKLIQEIKVVTSDLLFNSTRKDALEQIMRIQLLLEFEKKIMANSTNILDILKTFIIGNIKSIYKKLDIIFNIDNQLLDIFNNISKFNNDDINTPKFTFTVIFELFKIFGFPILDKLNIVKDKYESLENMQTNLKELLSLLKQKADNIIINDDNTDISNLLDYNKDNIKIKINKMKYFDILSLRNLIKQIEDTKILSTLNITNTTFSNGDIVNNLTMAINTSTLQTNDLYNRDKCIANYIIINLQNIISRYNIIVDTLNNESTNSLKIDNICEPTYENINIIYNMISDNDTFKKQDFFIMDFMHSFSLIIDSINIFNLNDNSKDTKKYLKYKKKYLSLKNRLE